MGKLVPVQAKGFKLRIGKYHFRFWSGGFEYGDHCGGRIILFPWGKPAKILGDPTPYEGAVTKDYIGMQNNKDDKR